MRKTKLFIVALLAMFGLSVNAQSWIAPTIAGEDPVDGQQYKVMNVGAGKYLDMGKSWFGWSTTAILSDKGTNFTMTADGDNWKFIRTGTQGVFTSGNGVPGDAMHVDNTAHTYNLEKMPNGNYRIHDTKIVEEVLVVETTTCWGNIEYNGVWGPVAKADASTIGENGEWLFVTEASSTLYNAQLALYNLLNKAQSEGVNTDAAATVYNNASATVEELNSAYDALKYAMNTAALNNAINGYTGTPVDITEYVLVNPDFEVPTASGVLPPGWTITIGGQNCGQQNRTDKNPETSLSITNFIEAWHPASITPGVIAQTVSILPEGTYVLECDASVCHDPEAGDGTDITGAFLFIKSSLKTEQEPVGNLRLRIKHYSVSFSHGGDGDVQFGLMATDEINANWLSADNFKILYAGPMDMTVYEGLLADAVAEANSVTNIPAAAKTALNDVVTANNKAYDKSEGYKTAIKAIQDATEVATALITPYKNYNDTKTLLAAIKDQPVWSDKDGAEATYNTAFATAAAEVEKATTVEEIEAQASALYAATKAFIATVEVADGQFFDLTSLIKNPHFMTGTTLKPTGWDATFQNEKPGGGWAGACELRASIHNYEAYHKAFELSQTIANMPKGTYKVTLQGFVRHDDADKDKTTLYCGIVSLPLKSITDEYSTTSYYYDGIPQMGDANYDSPGAGGSGTWQPNGMTGAYYWFLQENPSTGKPFYTNEVETLVPNDGDLKIGFKCESWSDWVLWDNFHLYYYGSEINITLDETSGSAFSEEFTADNLTLKKKVVEGYNTFILPFDLTKNQLGAKDIYSYKGDEEGVLQFKKASKILANTPYLVKFEEDSNEPFLFHNVNIVKAAESLAAEGTEYDFVGTFGVTTAVVAGDYVLGNGEFVYAKGGNKIKAFRAYIKKKAGEAEARTLQISIDGVTTAIDAIDGESTVSGAIYNLAGQQVKKAQKGLYIQNGKKLLVK